MPRKKEKTFIELLTELPWWITLLGAIISFLILKFVFPSIEFEQKNSLDISFIILNTFKNLSPIVAPFISLILLISSLFSSLKSSQNEHLHLKGVA